MSIYTDAEHAYAKEATKRWRNTLPMTTEEEYEYGIYQYRLKDYELAAQWYEKAAKKGYPPAQFALAMCIAEQRGVQGKWNEAEILFQQAAEYYMYHMEESDAFYRLGMLHLYGYGVNKDEKLAREYFQKGAQVNQGGALYELALFYRDGKCGYPIDIKKSREYLKGAYDAHWEDAIFADFALFTGSFEAYEYAHEIKEAYSFLLGQLMRVAEIRPSRESLLALSALYNRGYPGDSSEKKRSFQRKAKEFAKKAEQL